MSEDVKMEGSSNQNAQENIQDLRKALKQWESAFLLVHQRKPDKDDISKAPKDIKEKYHMYFKLKKQPETDSILKIKSPTPSASGEVWGTELNKKPKQEKEDVKIKTDSEMSKTSLTKLGDKLSHSMLKSSVCEKLKIRKDVFKKKDTFMPIQQYSSKTANDSEILAKSDNLSHKKNASPNTISGSDSEEDFSIKGDMFKGASKLFISSNSTTTQKFSITNRPRLSFITSGALKHIDVMTEHKAEESSESLNTTAGDVHSPEFQFDTHDDKKLGNTLLTEYSDLETSSSQVLSADEKMNVSPSSKIIKDLDKTHGNVSQCIDSTYTSFSQDKSLKDESLNLPLDKSLHVKAPNALSDKTLNLHQEKICRLPEVLTTNVRQSAVTAPSDLFSFMEVDACVMEEKAPVVPTQTAKSIGRGSGKRKRTNSTSDNRTSNKKVTLEGSSLRAKKQKVFSREQEESKTSSDIPDKSLPEDYELAEESDQEEKKPPKKTQIRKRTAASLNDNFVCLNMKRKAYRRKGAGMTAAQLRKKQWKAKMAARSKSFGSNKCFKCGQEGHWANKCTGMPKSSLPSQPEISTTNPVDESDFPSLREAAMMSRGIKEDVSSSVKPGWQDDITDIEASIVRERCQDTTAPQPVQPLSNCVQDIQEEITKALRVFGFSTFKPGQERSINRILQGLSTLVVLSTGGGKSLCYQLPAYLYAGHLQAVTLVISPLVSLMEDQISELPPGVKGACLHSGMTSAQRDAVIADLKEGKVHFLLISPEAIVDRSGSSQGSFPSPDRLPPIAFACIDEAHCMSEWSHNFRPSYLRLCKVLRDRYGVKCFLGLTATATKSTCRDVIRHLGIEELDGGATVRGAPVPGNLILSVSRDVNRDEALIELLKGDRFKSCESIIVYCSRREQTSRVATLIRTSMQFTPELGGTYEPPAKKPRGKKAAVTFDHRVWTCESYHAGLTPAKRRSVQKSFMSGRLRVVVATVAFGMGLDKANVRAVIHYSMPKSFESYVQEVGRAGRDGGVSHCHVFLDPENKDICELRRHTHGNSIDRITVKKLMGRVFQSCRCKLIYNKSEQGTNSLVGDNTSPSAADNSEAETGKLPVCGGHERALPIEETVRWLDVREEGISTLLCYLELHPRAWVENMTSVYATCSIKCYGGPSQLQALAKKCPPVGVAIAKQKKEGKRFSECSQVEFNVVELCDSMGWDSGTVKRELKSLEWETGPSGFRKSGALVELSNLAFHFRSRGDLSDHEMDAVTDFLSSRSRKQEKLELSQLDLLSETLKSVSYKNYWMCSQEADVERSDRLKKKLEEFFDTEERHSEQADGDDDVTTPTTDQSTLQHLCADVRQFVSTYGAEHTLTGRAIARIFHGIGSPNFPAETWGKVRRFWRSHLAVDFNVVIREATRILVSMK